MSNLYDTLQKALEADRVKDYNKSYHLYLLSVLKITQHLQQLPKCSPETKDKEQELVAQLVQYATQSFSRVGLIHKKYHHILSSPLQHPISPIRTTSKSLPSQQSRSGNNSTQGRASRTTHIHNLSPTSPQSLHLNFSRKCKDPLRRARRVCK